MICIGIFVFLHRISEIKSSVHVLVGARGAFEVQIHEPRTALLALAEKHGAHRAIAEKLKKLHARCAKHLDGGGARLGVGRGRRLRVAERGRAWQRRRRCVDAQIVARRFVRRADGREEPAR